MTENGHPSAEEPKGELLVYRSEEGQIKLEVRLENETVWLTQKMVAELFLVGVNTINYHIKKYLNVESWTGRQLFENFE